MLSGQLINLAGLYQIQNYGAENALVLAEWIFDNYQYEQLETICLCLDLPPQTYDDKGFPEKIWRLTPDTVRAWLAAYLDRRIEAKEQEIHNEPFKEVESEWEDEKLTEWLKEIEKVEQKKIPPITQEDILKGGQEKPKKLKPVLPLSSVDIENRDLANKYGVHVNQIKQLRIQWGRECHDLFSGRKLPTWITFAEWLTK